MYLNTLGKHELYQSLAEIMDTTEKRIKQYIIKNKYVIVDCYYNETSIQSMNLDDFMKYVECKRLNLIDKVIVHHITPRQDIDTVYTEGVLTLPNVLTKDTVLASYLREIGFTFDFMDNHVVMKKDENIVEISKLNFSNLHVRFGDNCTVNDFNINAYLFVCEFEVAKVRGWLGSPEILKSIATAFGKISIADNYADTCHNYLVSFEVSTDKIDLEGFSEEITDAYKTEILVKYVVMALAYCEMEKRPFFPIYNPVIYLKRDYNVPGDNICKVWELAGDGITVFPEEYRI